MTNAIAQASQKLGTRKACARVPVSATSFYRWRHRINQAKDPIEKPGPRKCKPFDTMLLDERLSEITPGLRRNSGTLTCWKKVSGFISRRDFAALAHDKRKAFVAHYRASLASLHWSCPGVAWAIDGAQLKRTFWMPVMDCHCRFRFKPLILYVPLSGPLIAEHLEALFKQMDPPLILKRDNGKEFNNSIHIQEELKQKFFEDYQKNPWIIPTSFQTTKTLDPTETH